MFTKREGGLTHYCCFSPGARLDAGSEAPLVSQPEAAGLYTLPCPSHLTCRFCHIAVWAGVVYGL